jgi:hypothetical protein
MVYYKFVKEYASSELIARYYLIIYRNFYNLFIFMDANLKMKEKIRTNINNPEELERLYRDDRKSFESGFEEICSETEGSELVKFWNFTKQAGNSWF